MNDKHNIRITGVPREFSPGAAYHPMFFAKQNHDTVIPIPGKGKPINNIKLSISERLFGKTPLKIQKLFFLIELLLLNFKIKQKKIFVHSFIYSLPLIFSGKKVNLIIHGSDYKKLDGISGRILKRYLNNIYLIGKEDIAIKHSLKTIPNIFNIKLGINDVTKLEDRFIDFCFILRDAKVKNPEFPEILFENINSNSNLHIIVIGIQGKNKVENKKSISYLGILKNDVVQTILSKSKVFILPSKNEGISKAMLEAMYNGCSTIINDGVKLPNQFSDLVYINNCDSNMDIEVFLNILKKDNCTINQKEAMNYLNNSKKILSKIYL